jgi:hypothetical protein
MKTTVKIIIMARENYTQAGFQFASIQMKTKNV